MVRCATRHPPIVKCRPPFNARAHAPCTGSNIDLAHPCHRPPEAAVGLPNVPFGLEFSRREGHGGKANETKPKEPEDGVGERPLVFRRAEAHLGAPLGAPAALTRRRRG